MDVFVKGKMRPFGTMNNRSEIGDRIKSLRKGETQAAFAKRLAIAVLSYQRYESGERIPPGPVLAKLSELGGVTTDWILTGADRVSEQSPRYSLPSDQDEFCFVPQVRGEISAGGGLAPDNNVEMKVAFRRDWISRRGNPENMALIRVSGDSMEPTFQSGDLVLVDHGRNYVDPQGGIYAIAIDQTIMIKRIQVMHPTNRLKVISDNGRYETIEADPEQLRINGKVIWFGRELER